jgi:acetyl esterase/lipase
MVKYILLPVLFMLITFVAFETSGQKAVPLYSGEIPGSKPVPDEEKSEQRDGILVVSNITRPTITLFAPQQKANDAAVIIFPGGGYRINAAGHEGADVARKLNEYGITAFVVKYRIPNDDAMSDRKTAPLQDAQQAIAHVRENAVRYGINSERVGIMGFSAGGHLASTAGTHFETPLLDYKVSVRPDFMILAYPVISFDSLVGHLGSRDHLLGKNPDESLVRYYSNDEQVNDKTPPTFLIHAADDDVVKVENSIRFFSALRKFGIPSELHVYQKGGHGFGLVNRHSKDLWLERCINWMQTNGWLLK